MSSVINVSKQSRLEALHERLDDLGLRGFWQLDLSQILPEPQVWHWHDIYSSLAEASELVELGADTARRNIGIHIGSSATTMGFQMVLPGETARAHRHTPSALRFVVQGKGAYTTGDGERMWMEPGDLLVQPNWTWHDHTNSGSEPVVWIDMLDSGLVRFLEGYFSRNGSKGILSPSQSPMIIRLIGLATSDHKVRVTIVQPYLSGTSGPKRFDSRRTGRDQQRGSIRWHSYGIHQPGDWRAHFFNNELLHTIASPRRGVSSPSSHRNRCLSRGSWRRDRQNRLAKYCERLGLERKGLLSYSVVELAPV
jgi:quercetin dioxygenase-like cupin family protein